MRKYIFIIFILLFFSYCTEWIPCNDTEFSFPRTENNSNKLKLGGYYYGNIVETNSKQIHIKMFFQNGILSNSTNLLVNAETGNVSFETNELAYKSKSLWGVFRIFEDSIEIQQWIPMNNGCVDVVGYKGIILNDTTFAITKWYNVSRKGTYTNINDTIYSIWKFHEYSPKPDSVVSFIP